MISYLCIQATCYSWLLITSSSVSLNRVIKYESAMLWPYYISDWLQLHWRSPKSFLFLFWYTDVCSSLTSSHWNTAKPIIARSIISLKPSCWMHSVQYTFSHSLTDVLTILNILHEIFNHLNNSCENCIRQSSCQWSPSVCPAGGIGLSGQLQRLPPECRLEILCHVHFIHHCQL